MAASLEAARGKRAAASIISATIGVKKPSPVERYLLSFEAGTMPKATAAHGSATSAPKSSTCKTAAPSYATSSTPPLPPYPATSN